MATQSLTGLALTQATDGTYKVDFGFTAIDGDNDVLALAYEYKLSTDSTWSTATTTAPASVTASGAGVAVAGVWDIDSDIDGILEDVTFNFRVTSTKAAVAAAGSLTAVAANATTGIKEADTFTVGGKTFEFTTDATVAGSNVPVTLATATDNATLVKAAIIAAINGSTTCTVSAVSGAGALITLAAKTSGVAGNVSITQSISNSATLTPVGMAGGLAAEAVAASANLLSASTGNSDTVPTEVPELTTNKHDKEINTFEQANSEKGMVAEGGFRWSRAKAALEAIRSGSYDIFTIYSDRALGEGVAVLVSPELYATLVGNETPNIVVKPAQWLMNVAWRSFSQLFKPATTVYAIQISGIAPKGDICKLQVISGTTVAYLVSYADYVRMSN